MLPTVALGSMVTVVVGAAVVVGDGVVDGGTGVGAGVGAGVDSESKVAHT